MVDPVTVEVVRRATIFIAEEMGVVLRRTAYSPNIRDRMDLSCAVASPRGEVVAQAEHIPVHLGSMVVGVASTLRCLEERGIELYEGDVVMVNDPYVAGTHLNDVMLLKPVYHGGRLVAYVVNKAHHVDVGGLAPGSMSWDARSLYEEGVVIEPVKLVEEGKLVRELLDWLLSRVRAPRYTKGDLMAQLAALNVGERGVRELVERYTRRRLREAPRAFYEALDYLEAGDELLELKVRVVLSEDKAVIDFTGTHEQVPYPLNAVYGVTVAATSYALKAVLDPELPMNHGFYKVVEVRAPQGSLVNPVKPASVAAGNVETSQRIAETVLKALAQAFPDKVPAASHGSMNNVMIGGDGWVFYETVGGGMGARPYADGVDGVHTHMTNTMNTPIEVIEREYPLLFIEYSLRPDSGGPGRYRGGLPGEPGQHYVLHPDGSRTMLTGKDVVRLRKGDVVYINTPSGGGYGDPLERPVNELLDGLEDCKITPKGLTPYVRG